MSTLNERMKELRKVKKMTQLELAQLLNITDKAVSKWESGDGNPDISLLPKIASIFGVSIDYLLTGIEKEPEVLLITKMELSCKNDDVDLFSQLNTEILQNKDESGKTIVDYLHQYNSPKVYASFVKKFGVSRLITNYHDRSSLKFDDIKVMKLFFKYDDLPSLISLKYFDHGVQRSQWGDIYEASKPKNKCIYVIKELETYYPLIKPNGAIENKCYTLHEGQMKNALGDWQIVYDKLLYLALENNREDLVNKIFNLIVELNDESIKAKAEASKDCYGRERDEIYHFSSKAPRSIIGSNHTHLAYYSIVVVSIETLNKMVEKGYLAMVKKLNEYNKMFKGSMISDGVLIAESMKQSGKGNKNEIFIVSCIEYGIVNIDKLLKCNDYKIIKYAFENFPVSIDEFLNVLLSEKDYKTMYEYAVDNDLSSLAQSVLLLESSKFGFSHLEKVVVSTIEKIQKDGGQLDVNRSRLVIRVNNWSANTKRKSSKEMKEAILKDLSLKMDKETLTAGLSEDYFNTLLDSNNIELLVVKLCVKLEAILKCDYKYEGDFKDMLDKFISKELRIIGNWDDEDNNYYSDQAHNKFAKEMTTLLNKLRKCRNDIVHAEKNTEKLSKEELLKLIKYIVKLG